MAGEADAGVHAEQSGSWQCGGGAMKTHAEKDGAVKYQEHLRRQRDLISYRMKKIVAKQAEFDKKTETLKEKIRRKYEDMQRVLDEDLRITISQLEVEATAVRSTMEKRVESCYLLIQHLQQELDQVSASLATDTSQPRHPNTETEGRIAETLQRTEPEHLLLDDFKNEQLLSLTINLLLFIRSQLPVSRKLLQSYATDVSLDPDSAHPKLVISPSGDCVTYTDTWQEVPDLPRRFDTTLNTVSRQGFGEGRHYWEVQVAGKTYWELGLTYPSIPRKGREEDCWLGRGEESWCVEHFNGEYTAWHAGASHPLPHLAGRIFQRIGVFSSSEGGLVSFLGVDTMTPLYSFWAGSFSNVLLQAVCPGHDNEGSNWQPLRICDASRSAPSL